MIASDQFYAFDLLCRMPVEFGTLILESCVLKKCPGLIVLQSSLEFIHEDEASLRDHCYNYFIALLIAVDVFLISETLFCASILHSTQGH